MTTPDFSFTPDTAKSGPSYDHSLLYGPGTAPSLATGATTAVATFTTTRRSLFLGYLASGDGAGLFYVTIDGGPNAFYRRVLYPNINGQLELKYPVPVDSGVTVTLYVTNEASTTQNYEGTILMR